MVVDYKGMRCGGGTFAVLGGLEIACLVVEMVFWCIFAVEPGSGGRCGI